jgi:hypothetical protein
MPKRECRILGGACGGGMNQLTHQEQKIVALIAQGPTNKEIAQPRLLSLYNAEPGAINHAEAGVEEPDSVGLPVRAAGEYC